MLIRVLYLAAALFVWLSATNAMAEARVKVVTPFSVLSYMAAHVAGEAADVVSITKQDP